MKYTKEFIKYVNEYPFTVSENFHNGIVDETVFISKQEALNYIERGKLKYKRATFKLVENKLDPKYL